MAFQYVTEHRDYLKREYQARAQRRPFYSQRAFARDIGLSPSSLNDYFKGRIRLSIARAQQIGKMIGLNLEQRQHWVDLLEMTYGKNDEIKKGSELRVRCRLQSQSHSISVDQFKVISEWFHLAYIELLQLDAKKYSDLKTGAMALNIPLRTLKTAVRRLEALALIKRDSEEVFHVNSSTQLGDSIPSMAIRQFHTQMIKKAAVALEEQPLERRFASTSMVALPQSDIDKILVDIKTLALRYLDPYLNQSRNTPKDSLYCLSLQFFDLLPEKERLT